MWWIKDIRIEILQKNKEFEKLHTYTIDTIEITKIVLTRSLTFI